MTTKDLLQERGGTHGIYAEQAEVTQAQRAVFRKSRNWDKLSPVQRDALEMISVKMSRILTGNPNHPDHWDDIGGYAKLAANGGYEP